MAAQKKTYYYNLPIPAESEHNARVKTAVLKNLVEKLTDKQFVEVLYPKIQKNPDFFTQVADNPLLKML